MGVTVADVLGLETLQQARLLTDADLRLTVVRGVAVIEVPVESFVRAGQAADESAEQIVTVAEDVARWRH